MTTETTDPLTVAPRRPRGRAWLLPTLGVALVVAAATLQVVGIVQAGDGNWERGSLFAWLAIGASALAFTTGLVAVMRKRVWRLGLLVMVLALLANPYLLVKLFAALG